MSGESVGALIIVARASNNLTDGQINRQAEQGAASDAAGTRGGFRSSRSYIRSLVEALTKAARLHAYSHLDDDEPHGCDDDDELQSREPLIGKRCGKRAKEQPDEAEGQPAARKQQQVRNGHTSSEDSDDILVSQMDISAAHLILDYMEKHLEDKQRLVREWRELNCCADEPAASNKASRLLALKRLAKVALADENRAKNRNLAALPFDRNRVRLGQKAAAAAAAAKKRKRSGKSSLHLQPLGADYINASLIFDDDQRRPTHIIAQAPTDSTCGQFWQVSILARVYDVASARARAKLVERRATCAAANLICAPAAQQIQ